MKLCFQSRNMKVLIILSMAMGMSMASLEPSDYHLPDSHDISTDLYLPPSSSSSSSPQGVQTPDFHYLPSTSHQSASSQNVIPNSLFGNHGQTHSRHQQQQQQQQHHQQHLSGLSASQSMSQYLPPSQSMNQYLPPSNQYLPSQLPQPSNQYLPSSGSNSQLSNQQSYRKNSINNRQRQSSYNSNTDKIASRMTYNRNNLQSQGQHSRTFTQAIPSSTYLPANKNQYQTDLNQPSNSILPPSNSYLTPNQFQMSGGYSSTQNQDRQSSLTQQSAGHYYPMNSGYPEAKNKGYNYDPPAKYEFEYMVNDHESGNDFGHKESRDGDVTQGEWYVLLSDGRRQKVSYIADANGYRPTITYEDAGAGRAGYDQGYHY